MRDIVTADRLNECHLVHGKPVWTTRLPDPEQARVWEAHWQRLDTSMAGRLFSVYRRHVRARCVARWVGRCFRTDGVYAECGCGSGETSSRIRCRRTMLAVDVCLAALHAALRQPCYRAGLLADARALPLKDESLDGVWNLGVLEHFKPDGQRDVLKEFHRVLKPGGCALLWWPHTWGLDHLLLSAFGNWFPPEPGRCGPAAMRSICREAGFRDVRVHWPLGDCGTELLVVCRK